MDIQYLQVSIREFNLSNPITIRLHLNTNENNEENEFYSLPLFPSYDKDIKAFVWLGVDIDLLKYLIHKFDDGSVELQTVVPKLTDLDGTNAHYIDVNGIPYKEITINQETIKEIIINKEYVTEKEMLEFEKYRYKAERYGSYTVFKLTNENA